MRWLSAGRRAASRAWLMAEGAGAPAPTGSGLQTDKYMALLNVCNRTSLQLYHGSTGAVMFRSGPERSESWTEEPRHAYGMVAYGEEIDSGHRRVCWLGWDGSVKEGLDGRQDFSAWLAPEVFRGLENGCGSLLMPGTIREAGYWRVSVPAPGGITTDTGRRSSIKDEAGLEDSGTVAFISNTESSVAIVLTHSGFIFRPEPSDKESLVIVSDGRRPVRLHQ